MVKMLFSFRGQVEHTKTIYVQVTMFQLDKSPIAMIVAIVANCSPTPNLRKSRNSYFPGSITIRFVWYEMGVRNDAELATISTSTASRRSSPADTKRWLRKSLVICLSVIWAGLIWNVVLRARTVDGRGKVYDDWVEQQRRGIIRDNGPNNAGDEAHRKKHTRARIGNRPKNVQGRYVGLE